MLWNKIKEDNKKTMLEDVGVMKLTQELVALRGKVWVLIPTSLTLMVQRSTQFKVNPTKPFDGKTLDGTALESWLYQMNLYFSMKTGMPENLRVA